jgi:hypothetical protein
MGVGSINPNSGFSPSPFSPPMVKTTATPAPYTPAPVTPAPVSTGGVGGGNGGTTPSVGGVCVDENYVPVPVTNTTAPSLPDGIADNVASSTPWWGAFTGY